MAYTNRTITLTYEDLGDDIYVTIHNPMLMPLSMLQPRTQVRIDPNTGEPVDPELAIDGAFEVAARLIVAWNVYDPFDDSENPTPLPMPATAEVLKKLPQVITMRISEFVGKKLNPTNENTSKTS